jgi:hypothetical protein
MGESGGSDPPQLITVFMNLCKIIAKPKNNVFVLKMPAKLVYMYIL